MSHPTLPDFVRDALRVLVCGLNPSPHAVETGIPFGRPGNRFWPAAVGARLAPTERDVSAALEAGIGFTDLCKRPTRRAAEIRPAEYVRGLARVEKLVRAHAPRVVCFVGLQGYRSALDRRARAGLQDTPIATARVYLMPSTSGLNAHDTLASLTRHLVTVRSIALALERAGGSARESNPPKTCTQASHGI